MLRRAAAAAEIRRRERQSDELSLKRQRSDNGLSVNNNSSDVINHMPQVAAADFSTIKHNNNNTPPMKDAEQAEDYSSDCKSFVTFYFFTFPHPSRAEGHFILFLANSDDFSFSFRLLFCCISKFIAPNNLTNNIAPNGNGLSSSSIDKDSLTPSPPNRLNDDVKSEPMELVCGNHNLPSDEHSNDSVGDNDSKYLGGKGSLR